MLGKIINTFGTKLMAAIINLFIAIIISQYLGASGKGEQVILITTITFILVFSNIIGGSTLVYLTPRYSLSSLIVPSYIWTIFVSGIFFTGMCFFPFIKKEYVIHIAVLSMLNSLVSINLSILLGKEKIKTNNLISFIQTASILISLLIMFWTFGESTVQSYINALYIAFTLSLLLSIIFLFPYIKKMELKKSISGVLKEMIRFGLFNQIATIAQILSFRISYYFIEYFHGTADVGIYSNGVSLIEAVWLVSASITMVQYSRIVNSTDDAYSQKISISLAKISLLLAFIIIIPLLFIPSTFYEFIFGREFGQVNEVMWCLAPGILVFNLSLVLGHYFSGTGKYHINTIAMLAGLIITIVCGLIFIPLYNVIGAGITASISYIVTSLIITIIFIRKAKCSVFDLVPMPADIGTYFKEMKLYLKPENK